MATYLELTGLIVSRGELVQKITAAVAIAADTIMNEASATPNHDNRLRWAKEAFVRPRAKADQMMAALIAQNKNATVAAIEAASDAAIQANVDAAIDIFADDPPVVVVP